MTEIEKIERAIISVDDRLKKAIWRLETLQGNDETIAKKQRAVENLTTCLTALTEKLHRLQNPPLTLQQLKDRVGKPVFIKHMWHDWSHDGWAVVEQFEASQFGESMRVSFGKITLDNYNICWLAYDHEPERSQ